MGARDGDFWSGLTRSVSGQWIVSLWLRPRAEAAHQKDDHSDEQDQTQSTATDGRASKIKAAATE
jgi:hypothetical protein